MSEQTEEEYLIERLSKLLAEISVIVNGPQPMGVLWSYADLPEKVQALKDAAPPRPQAKPVLVVNRNMLATLGPDRWIPAMLPADDRAETDLLLYATPQPQPQAEPVWQYRMATHPRGWIDTSSEDAARWGKGGFEVRCVYAAPQPQAEPVEFQVRFKSPGAQDWSKWYSYELRAHRDEDAACDRGRGWQVETRDLYAAPQREANPQAEPVEVDDAAVERACKAFWGFIDKHGAGTGGDGPAMRAALLAAAPPRPQASAEDVRLVGAWLGDYAKREGVQSAWQRIEADVLRMLGVRRD